MNDDYPYDDPTPSTPAVVTLMVIFTIFGVIFGWILNDWIT